MSPPYFRTVLGAITLAYSYNCLVQSFVSQRKYYPRSARLCILCYLTITLIRPHNRTLILFPFNFQLIPTCVLFPPLLHQGDSYSYLADSPNPPTPTLSGFTPDQSVDEGNRNDIDPFETPTRADELEKDPSAVVPPVPLMHDVKRLDLRESPSQLNSVEEPVRPSQASADILELGRPISRLEKPFTCGASVSFHDCPREYTPCRKMGTSRSNIGALNAVFVLRSAPQIIEEDSSDEESGPEETGDGDGTAYSFPCGDSEVDELVSKVLSLSLGTGSTVARPTVTPTRVHTRASAFVPARTPPPSPAALSRPVVAHSSTADHPTPMEVDEDVLYPKVMNKGASHPQEISEAAPMDDVVFHPEVRDVEMADAFATNRELSQVTHICGSLLIL